MKATLAPLAAVIITYGTRSPTFGAVAASLCQISHDRSSDSVKQNAIIYSQKRE